VALPAFPRPPSTGALVGSCEAMGFLQSFGQVIDGSWGSCSKNPIRLEPLKAESCTLRPKKMESAVPPALAA
jgi:hypothetical protein